MYFAESITTKVGFYALTCAHFKDVNEGGCGQPTILIGEYVPVTTRGYFYFTTTSQKPFALGLVGATQPKKH